MADSAITMTIP